MSYFPGLTYKSFFKISHPASVLAVACLQHTVRGTHPSIWKATPCLAFNMYSWCETASRNTDRGRNKQSVYSLPDTAAAVYFFLDTPTVFPLWPVVLVCCPLTWGKRQVREDQASSTQRQSYPKAPVVPKTPVGADLLQTLKILTKLVVQHVGHDLRTIIRNHTRHEK